MCTRAILRIEHADACAEINNAKRSLCSRGSSGLIWKMGSCCALKCRNNASRGIRLFKLPKPPSRRKLAFKNQAFRQDVPLRGEVLFIVNIVTRARWTWVHCDKTVYFVIYSLLPWKRPARFRFTAERQVVQACGVMRWWICKIAYFESVSLSSAEYLYCDLSGWIHSFDVYQNVIRCRTTLSPPSSRRGALTAGGDWKPQLFQACFYILKVKWVRVTRISEIFAPLVFT